MINNNIFELMQSFNRSFINQHGEFIACEKTNLYFMLSNCADELEVKCKVLEWFSRDAFKTEPFRQKRKNEEYHNFVLNGINSYLKTSFASDDIEKIYQYLGNQINRNLTIDFIKSGYDITVLI